MNLIDISFIERGYAEVLKRNDKNWHSGRPQMYMWEKCGGDSPENEDDIYRLKKANDLILEVRREQTACYL